MLVTCEECKGLVMCEDCEGQGMLSVMMLCTRCGLHLAFVAVFSHSRCWGFEQVASMGSWVATGKHEGRVGTCYGALLDD